MIQYDPHSWREHFFDVKGSLLREITWRVLFCTVWSIGVAYVHYNVRPLGTPTVVHQLVGLALGLLLVFRTNASYDRFWEGRKLWGGMVNESRNLIRASETLLKDAPDLRKEILHWLIAFVYASMHILRGKKDIGPVANDLAPADAKAAVESSHPALFAAKRISAAINQARTRGLITDVVQVAVDQNVQLMVDYLGGCERIHKTPLPFAYVIHLRRALFVYCFTLPLALLSALSSPWGVVLDTLFLCYVFFGIEEIGVEIEDPFGTDENDLPLEDICASIRRHAVGMST